MGRKLSVSFSLDPDLVARLDSIAYEARVSKSLLVGEAIARELRRYEESREREKVAGAQGLERSRGSRAKTATIS